MEQNADQNPGGPLNSARRPGAVSAAWPGPIQLLVCVLGALMAAGCQSPPAGGEGSIAWVEITNHSRLQIADATKAVLVRQGYRFVTGDDDVLIFDKPGSAWNQVTWGGWGESMTARIKAYITRQPDDNFLLHCRVYMIRQLGDPVFEDKTDLTRFHRKPYQEYLDQIKASLDAKPPAGAGNH